MDPLPFWKRQFQGQRTLHQVVFDLIFGVVAPLLCIYFDPIVFVDGSFARHTLLPSLKLFCYLQIFISVLILLYFVSHPRRNYLLTGALLGSAAFSCALGIAMLPLTLIGMLAIIGILGLLPFATSFVFLRNGIRAYPQQIGAPRYFLNVLRPLCGVVLVCSMPIAVQVLAIKAENQAVTSLVNGNQQDFRSAARTLQLTWSTHKTTDRIVAAYLASSNEREKDRLARAYLTLTGKSIEDRIREMND